MYIQKTTHDVESFLNAIGFIPPEGFEVDYFIIPRGSGVAVPQNPSMSQSSYKDDESITYTMTQPILKHDTADTPMEYQIWDPPEIGRRQAAPAHMLPTTDPSDLECPHVKIQESVRPDRLEFSLRSQVGVFPRGTYFSCRRSK